MKINFEALLRVAVLAGLLWLLIKLIASGELNLLVNPRNRWLIELSGYALFVLLAVQVATVLDGGNNQRSCGCAGDNHVWGHIPFLITLLLAFGLPFKSLDENLVTAKGLNSRLAVESAFAFRDMPRPLAKQLGGMENIVVTDQNFIEVVSEIILFPRDYVGKEITMKGFVFKESNYAPEQLAVARYVIVCCAADAAPYGLLCSFADAGAYKEGDWLNIRGEIVMGRFQDRGVPLVRIKAAEQVAQPKNPYVYPFVE
jgi:putative membrane protein